MNEFLTYMVEKLGKGKPPSPTNIAWNVAPKINAVFRNGTQDDCRTLLDGLLGEVDITKIRHIVFRTELYGKFLVSQVMVSVPAVLYTNEPMEEVMRKFERCSSEYLPVVDINNRLNGFISRTRMYAMYRKMVADLSEE